MSAGGSWLKLNVEYSDEKVRNYIANLRELSTKPQFNAVLNSIGNLYKAQVLRNFANESSPDGKPWAHLTAATIRAKALGRKDKPSMTRYVRGRWSGDLIKSIRSRTYKDKGNMVVIGSNLKYAKHFNFGDPSGSHSWGPVPARPFLGFKEETSTAVKKLIVAYLISLANTP